MIGGRRPRLPGLSIRCGLFVPVRSGSLAGRGLDMHLPHRSPSGRRLYAFGVHEVFVRGPRLLNRVPLVTSHSGADAVLGHCVTHHLLYPHSGMCRCGVQENAPGALADSYVTADATAHGPHRGCPGQILLRARPFRQVRAHPPFVGHGSRLSRNARAGHGGRSGAAWPSVPDLRRLRCRRRTAVPSR